MDPTSLIVKNVAPNCYLIQDIIRYFKNINAYIDGFKKSCLEEIHEIVRKRGNEDPEKVLLRNVEEACNGAKGWVEKLFNLQRVERTRGASNDSM